MKYAALLVPGFSTAGQPVKARIESAVRTGIPDFRISGIPPARARDMAERIQCAFQMSGFRPGHKSMVVHIEGNLDSSFLEELDLPVAACVLGALGFKLHGAEEGCSYLGKLLLSGDIRPVAHLLRYLVAADMLGLDSVLANPEALEAASLSALSRFLCPGMPSDRNPEASNVHGTNPRARKTWQGIARGRIVRCLPDLLASSPPPQDLDFPMDDGPEESDDSICYQSVAEMSGSISERPAVQDLLSLKPDSNGSSLPYSRFVMRAAVAAAGGRHSLLCLGPPGCGKTTLAGLIHALLPAMDENELRRVFLASFYESDQWGALERPFRRPHHSATRVALVGGGSPVRAGEVSLASDGLLLLDELGEFRRDALQALREPMDSGVVHISRGHHRETLPALFWLVATANGCPCGQAGSRRRCQCTAQMVRQYRLRMLGALQDRMAIELIMESEDESCDLDELKGWYTSLVSMQKHRQWKRPPHGWNNTENRIQRKFNAELEPDQCRFATSEVEERFHLETEGWTNRKRNGIRRLARSMADMSGAAQIQMEHMLEALRYAGLTESIFTLPENGKAPWQSG